MRTFGARFGIVLGGVSVLLSGCYFNESVNENQVGIRLSGGQIVDIVGAGVHTDLGWFSSLEQISRNPIDFTVEDGQVLTENRQSVGIKLNVKMARPSQPEQVTELWRSFNNLAVSDEPVPIVMDGPVRQAIKVNVAQFTLDELIVDRNGLRDAIFQELGGRAAQYRMELLSVDIADVVVDANYTEELQKRQLIDQQRLTAEQERRLVEQQTSNEKFKVEQDRETAVSEANKQAEIARINSERERAVALVKADQDKQVAAIQADVQRLKADAQAYEVTKIAAAVTPAYIDKLNADARAKWDGKLPQQMWGGSGPIPFLDVDRAEEPPQP